MEPELLDGGPRPAVRVVRHYEHPVDRVWRAVTTPEHLSSWFPATVSLDLREGGAVDFGFGPPGWVLAVDAPRHLAFTWGDDRLDFHLAEDSGGTRFTLTHTIDDRPGAASFAAGWEGCLGSLSSVLAGTEVEPAGRREGRHEELVERFGLDRPVVARSPDGWTARFERQLVCPAGTAWALFFGGAPAPEVGASFRPAGAPSVVLGTVTAVEEPSSFAFDVAPGEPGGAVLLSLGPGTGHGARLVLEVSGPDPAELDAAVEQWGAGAVAHVAAEALRLVPTH